MAKKRLGEDLDESSTQAKKGKAAETAEFNGTVFKAMLKEPTRAMKGLETFISTAKKLPCKDLYDVVEGYIKISMECAEIFKLLEGEKQTESEMLLIFQSLEMVLLRTASDLSHFSTVGTTIVKKTVSSYMKLLQTSMYSENHRFVRQCLSFLSAMVSQGTDTAREVCGQVNFSKSLSGLARRKDKMGRPDIRMAYVQFALSFLVSGDNATIVQLLEMKDFLPDILSSGLKEDRISIVNLILSTLQTKVVQNKSISKTQKLRFFSPAVLSNIASLYRWNGIVDASTDDSKMAENAEEAGKMVVRELVHNFLLDLCCSRKHGISFYDPSFGTAGRAGNIILLQFVVGLKQATEDELVADLVVSVLKVSPDLLPRYFKETQYSFTPRLKSAWQDNVTLLKKIYEAQPEVSKALHTREFVPLPRLLSMVMVTSLPPVCNKAFFTQGLNFANTVVQHSTLSMASFILRRAHQNMRFCLDRAVWQGSDLYTPAMMEDLVQQYREALSKILPDITSIVSKWQSLTKKDKAGDKGAKEKKDKGGEDKGIKKDKEEDKETKEKKAGSKDDATKTVEPGPESAELILLKALVLQVMCLYQRVVPHLVSQSKFDFSKLLKGIVSEKGIREEVPPVLQYQILQLALDLPASKFSWFRVQDVVETEAAGGEKSVFYLLLMMFVTSNNSQLKTSTRMLVLKVLKDSGVFEYTWTELELWLSHLARLHPAQQETVIQFLERVLVRLVCNPYTYTDKVASLVQEAAYLQANLSGQEGDAASLPISHIDDVLDMVDVIMESSEGEAEEFGPSLSDDLITQTFPFSAVVPAVLEARNKLPPAFKTDKGVVYEYLAAVLSDVLHCQRDPLPLCLALQHYDKELRSSDAPGPPHPSIVHLHRFYSRWLPAQSQEELFKSSESPGDGSPPTPGSPSTPGSFTAVMKSAYSQGASAFLDESFRRSVAEALSTMEVSDFTVAVKQVLLYIRSTVENFSTFSKATGVPVVSTLFGVLQDLVTKLQSSQDAPEPLPVDAQGGSDLFLEINQSPGTDANKDQVLVSVLSSIFKHPCLETWFLAVELSSAPPHTLNPVRLRSLCTQLNTSLLSLLQACAPTLRALGCLELVAGYLGAVETAILRELEERGGSGRGDPPKGSGREEGGSYPVRGLLALHPYMDPPRLNQVVSTLLLLPQESLTVTPDDDSADNATTELSVYGRAALQVLTESSSQDSPSSPALFSLSQAHLQGLGTLLLSCHSPTLEDFLLQVLRAEPGSAKLVHTDVLLHCLLQKPRPSTPTTQDTGSTPPTTQDIGSTPTTTQDTGSTPTTTQDTGSTPTREIGALLLTNCSTHRLRFELWCLEAANQELLSAQTEDFLPLVNTYLQTAARDDPARPGDVRTAVLEALKQTLLAKLSVVVLGAQTDYLARPVEALVGLVQLAATVDDVRELVTNLPAALQDAHGFERWQLVDPLSARLAQSAEELEAWRKQVLSAALRWLISSYNQYKEQDSAPSGQEEDILKRLQGLLTFPEDISVSEWNSFVKVGLKYRYRDPRFLNSLDVLLKLMYGGGDAPTDLLPLPMMHLMTSSHSLFLPTMLGTDQDVSAALEAKEALVSLLLTLVKSCPAVCNISHFVVLMGAYGATLSTSDQKLLLLLQEYEKNNISLVEFQSLLWGPAAVEHHKARKSLGASLWQQPSSEALLALLDQDRMAHTLSHFPQQRRIIPQEGKELLYREEEGEDLASVYDPCYLLPLFSTMLRPESVIDCLKFVTSRALGVAVASLSSYDPKLRAAAYQVLGCFCQHLQGARFREKTQLLYLLEMVRNSVRQLNLRLPFLLTSYISRVALQMLKPEEHMYVVVNRFLLSHQSLDFRRVPDFFKLFYSFDMENKVEREWLLGVLEEGVSDRYCYELCDQQGIFQTLLGFGSSPLCDEHTQTQIVRVLRRAAHVTKAAYDLTKGHGLLTWLLQRTEGRHLDQRLLVAVIDLLHVLWFTNLGQKENQGQGPPPTSSSAAEDKPQGPPKCLPLPLISDFLCVASTIIRHLKTGVKAAPLRLLLQTLSSVLMHRGTALRVHGEAGWLTLRPQALSSPEALALLHRWASLSHDATLLAQLQGVAEQHRLRELLGSGKEKGRGKGSSPQARLQAEELDDAEVERQEQALLTECKPHLRNIFSHWSPVPPSPTGPQSSQPLPQQPDKQNPGCLGNVTAHTLIKWSLRSLVEGTYEEKRTTDFLHWFQTIATPHEGVVEVLMSDPALKVDFLRLYHQAFEPQNRSQGPTRVETLELFTTVMLRLLEVKGGTSDNLHQAVLAACLTDTTHDQARKEAGLLLLSLYIHELWSGAKSPEMFLTHIRLVTGTKAQKKSRHSSTQAAIRNICTDLVPAMESVVSL